jgi:hypothetical protein
MQRSIFLLPILLLVSCTLSTANLNRPEDIARAKAIGERFYEELKTNDYPKTYQFYADTFFNKVDTSVLLNFYKTYHEKLGDVKSFKVAKCDVKCTDGLCSYTVVYDVQRDKDISKEVLVMTSKSNEVPKLIGYTVLERNKH